MSQKYECIIIGAGHAGIEAALSASRMGCATLLLVFSQETIGQMSCNPAIGGVGKGQLVKEIDALGGEMGLAADYAAIQYRQLNASKGQAVRSSRCQADRKQYRLYMQKVIERQENLSVLSQEASEILVANGRVLGIKTVSGETYHAPTVVVATGTFLRGRIHIGKKITAAGRVGEPAASLLADSLSSLGFEILSFKTGTPPRLDGRTIDFSKMVVQHSDERPVPFSFRGGDLPADKVMLPCYITRTGEELYELISANLHLSPMYSGRIHATGVRYCPSIEDKIKKFPEKRSHHVFLEPEGLDTFEYYPNGISTGLPEEIQEKMVHSIEGLERARLIRPGYSIEHGVIRSTELMPSLESKSIPGLFFAGQINGTTGYEEAAAQGLMAGINAALKLKNKEPFILKRDQAYIGVLIDDLTTKGTEEPYRMFTSRVEYRLVIREDNADQRLAKYGYEFGLLGRTEFEKVQRKYDEIEKEIQHLRTTRIYPGSPEENELRKLNTSLIRQPTLLSDILKRPEIRYRHIAPYDGHLRDFPQEIIDQVEYEIKYEGFIRKQFKDVERFNHIEKIKIPSHIDYDKVAGLSAEIREKLKRFAPLHLGQAHRISGVTPAAISILMIYLKKLNDRRRERERGVEK
ncbi:MAG: tRNA uridine-5-carboxymethylaminomethyl(34) synthesis enzyme MnmG [Candidatus Omnitrophota bacterium]